MTILSLVRRGLQFHTRSYLGVVLGAAIGSAALIGALVVGDSVKHSLLSMNLSRLGEIALALPGGDRVFREALALDMQSPAGPQFEPVLALQGTASLADGSARANQIQILGVGDSFWNQSSGSAPTRECPVDGVLLNEVLQRQLGVQEGDTIILRFAKPSQFSSEATLSPKESIFLTMRLTVAGIVGAENLGNFSLRVSQVPPFNAFVRREQLQAKAEVLDAVNLLTVSDSNSDRAQVRQAQESLRDQWQLADAQVSLVRLTNQSVVELHSSRIFLDPPVVEAAQAGTTNIQAIYRPLLTYLVNELRAGTNAAPYSMVTAAGAPWTPPDMADEEILVNQWLADDLGLAVGDTVSLSYFLADSGARLIEQTNHFRVRGVVPMEMPWSDSSLMPEFPGIAKAESTHEWDAGFPLVHTIREKDDQYWKDWRGTPKAFVTLEAGQSMWGNRYGALTAVRWEVPPGQDVESTRSALGRALLGGLQPSDIGLKFVPVREQALAAAHQSQDFGGLFLGFSFFLIVAALILMSLLFQFSLEQRFGEIGTLLAVGFTPAKVRRVLLGEGVVVASIGGVLGVAGGLAYASAMLWGLTNLWRDAVGTSSLQFFVTTQTLLIGLIAAVVVCIATIALVLRKQAKRPARALLAEGAGSVEDASREGPPKKSKSAWIGLGALLVAAGLVIWAKSTQEASAGVFFGAGSLLLISGLAFSAALFAMMSVVADARKLTVTAMGLRGITRQRRRGLACVALLACGSFMVVAVGGNKLDASTEAEERSSGTGGFAFIGQSTLPVLKDLNTSEGREFFGLSENALQDVSFVSMRVRNGDEASCLNLNRAQNPRLLGVNPRALADRQAFTFAKTVDRTGADNPWMLLRSDDGESDVVPAIGDLNSIMWAMGKSVGDTLDYTDEQGRTFKVKLVGAVANSILQGNLLVDERAFLERFPSESGYRMFLVDASSNGRSEVAAHLSRALRDVGLELTPAVVRLNQFNAVQNTYLNTFQILGGLGLLLGSAGLGVVVLRNVLERRGELALLQAVGFRRKTLRWMVLAEHGGLLLLGMVVGMVAALVAILPVLLRPGSELPALSLALTLAGVLGSGILWTWLATMAALRGDLLPALRNE